MPEYKQRQKNVPCNLSSGFALTFSRTVEYLKKENNKYTFLTSVTKVENNSKLKNIAKIRFHKT